MILDKQDIINIDKLEMRKSIYSFPIQIDEMINQYESYKLKNRYTEINNILVLGMGGSAIGAEICQALIKDKCSVPIIVNRNYIIPNWVNSKTLVIASSYSGETEETIEAYSKTIELTKNIIIVSTGGVLSKMGNDNNHDVFIIPKSYQPRAAIGYSVMSILFMLIRLNIIDSLILNEIKKIIGSLLDYSDDLSRVSNKNQAMLFSEKILNTVPVIYGSSLGTEVVALRFKGQLQENSKIIAYHNIVPEMNHNEIEGWNLVNNNKNNNFSVIWLHDRNDHQQINKRMIICKELLENMNIKNYTLEVNGSTFTERLFKLIVLTDWISFYLAIRNNIDPSPVKTISKLKDRLK